MEIPLFGDIVVIFGLSVVVLLVFHHIKAPTIVGFLLTGVIAGPQALGLVRATEEVGVLAEIGVILLLFTVGIEISLKDLLKLRRYVLLGGFLQVLLTVLAVVAILRHLGVSPGTSILMGFLIALSSTAIVLRIIQKRAEFDTLHGRTTLGILIFQDVVVVPMMLLIPLLPGAQGEPSASPFSLAARAAAIVVLAVLAAKHIVPWTLYQIARTKDRELFLLSLVAICLAVAWATSLAGLSLGLGAFLAGLIISESEYSHQAFGNVLPLRDVFTSFFFISVGMLLDLDLLLESPGIILLLATAVMALKSSLAGLSVFLLGLPVRTVVLVGLGLSQVGEFSFILSKVGLENGLLSPVEYQVFLSVTVLTMGATSLMTSMAPRLAERAHLLPLPRGLIPVKGFGLEVAEALKDHLIVVGYGVNGRNLSRAAKKAQVPYVILEADPDIVREERRKGEPIFYGDAAQESVLRHAGGGSARVTVVAISDPATTRRIVSLAREINPDLYIIVRTRYLREIEALHGLGADEVIPEEFETSVEIFARVLESYQVPKVDIERFISDVRSAEYEMFRGQARERLCDAHLCVKGMEIRTFEIAEGSPLIKTMGELLERGGVELLAVHRGGRALPPGLELQSGDGVSLMGPPAALGSLASLFNTEVSEGGRL